MDVGEWVLIPDAEFLEMYDKGKNQEEDYWRSFFGHPQTGTSSSSINKVYFSSCSSPESPKPMNYTGNVVPFQLEQTDDDDGGGDVDINILPPTEPNFLPSVIAEKVQLIPSSMYYDHGDDSFKKSWEYELVDNEIKLPKNCSKKSSTGSHISIWTWSLKGFGAICSFGVAAAAICFINFLNHQNSHHHHHHHKLKNISSTTTPTMKRQEQDNHDHQIKKFQLQIFSNHKRIKQVFDEARKLSEAISGARRAQITMGSDHDEHQQSL